MNRELKAAIALLLVIVGLIAYFEMNSTEEVLGPVEPIEDVTLVPEPIEVEVKPQVELPVEPIAPKPPAVAKVVVPEPMPEPVVAPEPVVVNQDPILEKPVIDVVPEEPSDLIKVSPSIPSEYIVQKGDTVSGISEKVLGSIHFQKLLLNANPEL
jgi:nucleoid-associated protein YgaU